MFTLKFNGEEYEVPVPSPEQLDLGRARSVAALLFSLGMEVENLPEKIAKVELDQLETLLDKHFDNEVASERLSADLNRRLTKYLNAVGKEQIVTALADMEPSVRAVHLLDIFAQIFEKSAGDEKLLKN